MPGGRPKSTTVRLRRRPNSKKRWQSRLCYFQINRPTTQRPKSRNPPSLDWRIRLTHDGRFRYLIGGLRNATVTHAVESLRAASVSVARGPRLLQPPSPKSRGLSR
jgi:hypothetical protein